MKVLRATIAILVVFVLTSCGSNPAELEQQACDAFTRGVDRLNVDDTAYDSFKKAYEAFDKLAKDDEFFVRFGNIAYQLSDPDSLVAWSDIDEVASYCGDPVFTD
jgi:hypothetical protein